MPPTALDLDRGTDSWTALDLIEHFGPIPLSRVVTVPIPGTANRTASALRTRRRHPRGEAYGKL